jgi:hypothetical protein
VPAYSSVVLVKESDDLCGMSTGVDDLTARAKATDAFLYPNPARAGSTVSFAALISGTVDVLDAQGRVAVRTVANPGTLSLQLPADLTPGMYVVRCTTTSGVEKHRLVID